MGFQTTMGMWWWFLPNSYRRTWHFQMDVAVPWFFPNGQIPRILMALWKEPPHTLRWPFETIPEARGKDTAGSWGLIV